jgi:hypothetical protein
MSEFSLGWQRYFSAIEAKIGRQTDDEWRKNCTETLEAEKRRARTVQTARPPQSGDLRGIGFDGVIYGGNRNRLCRRAAW